MFGQISFWYIAFQKFHFSHLRFRKFQNSIPSNSVQIF
ncbi:hypothetical protein LINPERPRIM_LOCUS14599 [Linum perenne]